VGSLSALDNLAVGHLNVEAASFRDKTFNVPAAFRRACDARKRQWPPNFERGTSSATPVRNGSSPNSHAKQKVTRANARISLGDTLSPASSIGAASGG
jgi:hypothetical protein